MSLTDGQWAVIEPLLPVPQSAAWRAAAEVRPAADPGHDPVRAAHRLRLAARAARPGPVGCGHRWFAAWSADGTWRRGHDALRAQGRERDGRDRQPTAAVLDPRAAGSAEDGEAIGYDAGERVRGRERHLLVDTDGLLPRAWPAR